MKSILLKQFSLSALLIVSGYMARATEITLDPASLDPSPTGYYIAGADVDKNNDGVTEHYDKCFDAYGDAIFNEVATLDNKISYAKCMVMPSCVAKGTPTVVTGFLGLGKFKIVNFGTDSVKNQQGGTIKSPQIKNLTSIYLETSSDNVVLSNRRPCYHIEFSKDNGVTWDENYILDYVAAQGGYTMTYDVNTDGFAAIKTASEAGPIVVRIATNIYSGDAQTVDGQRVFVHKLIFNADVYVDHTSVNLLTNDKLNITVSNGVIVSKAGEISVYSAVGQLVGAGKTVVVPTSGIYIVKNASGKTQKVFIK